MIAQLHQVTGEKSDPRCRFEKAQSPKQWLAGGAFDWAAVTPSEGAVSAEVLALLPLYPFTRQRYWAEGLLAESTPLSSPSVIAHPLIFHLCALGWQRHSLSRLERYLMRMIC
ncbi:hypothetical protein FIO06_17375 [Yersinia pestis]|nr:hypothetical protein FIO06_17375 [Yersinia pestis]